MDGTVSAALVSGAVALIIVLVTQPITYYFSRKRDHNTDWRKMKLEQYKEYVAALSGTVHHSSDAAVQQRFSDAFNSMALVTPQTVLVAMYALKDETSKKNQEIDLHKYELLLSSLMRAMRKDCRPKKPKDDPEFIFHTISC